MGALVLRYRVEKSARTAARVVVYEAHTPEQARVVGVCNRWCGERAAAAVVVVVEEWFVSWVDGGLPAAALT